MERITEADIEEMRRSGYDISTIVRAEEWLKVQRKAEERAERLIMQIEQAFDGVTLGDGIGLWESNGIDDYADKEELRRLREGDEKIDWRAIPAKDLSFCHAAPSFLDAHGMYFHTPAFMRAELRGEFGNGFVDRLISPAREFIHLLTPEQRHVIIAYISFYASFQEFNDEDLVEGIMRYCFPIGEG